MTALVTVQRVATLAHDKKMAADFLDTLDPGATKFTFQFLGDRGSPPGPPIHVTLDEVWPLVQANNTPERGMGAFVTINETDLKGRKTENIIRPRALWVDADNAVQLGRCVQVITATGATPTMVIRTGPDRAHFYWCGDDIPRETFTRLQAALIERLGTDPLVKDLPRVMRLAGTLHLKDPNSPHRVGLKISPQPKRWKVADLAATLGLVAVVDQKSARSYSASNPDALLDPAVFPPGPPVNDDLAAGIADDTVLPQKGTIVSWCKAIGRSPIALNKLGEYGNWVFSLGFPLADLAHQDRQCEDFYRNVFMTVSRAAPKFDEVAADRKWDDLVAAAGQDRGEKCTWRSLRHFAREHGYRDHHAILVPPAEVLGACAREDSVDADPLSFNCLPTAEAVARINTAFFVRRNSGKIYHHSADGELNALSKQDFKTALGARWVEIDGSGRDSKRRPAADAWLDDPGRREYLGFEYCPNNTNSKPNHLNLWAGWGGIEPVLGDCSTVTNHVLNVVAAEDQAKSEFLLDWLADILQNPTRKPGVCVVLRGRQGTGKSVIGAIMRRLLGPKNVLTTSEKDRILGRFNASAMNKILIIGEEMLFARDHATTDKLKHLITGQTLPIEFKFGDALEIDSYHRLLLTSNHEQVFQAAGEERRFVTYDVLDAKRGDPDYFGKLYAVADGRDDLTAAAFMHFLLERDLASFRPWKAQQQFANDSALTRQKVLGFSAPLSWLKEVVDNATGQGPSGGYNWIDGLPYARSSPVTSGMPDGSKWPPQFPRSDALKAYRDWAKTAKPFGASEYTGSPERFWAEIHRIIPLTQTSRKIAGGVRTVTIDLADLQANFERYLRGEPL